MSWSTLEPIPMSQDVTASCDDCHWSGSAEDCQPIKDPSQRLNAGSEVPAGECPECSCLAYVDRSDQSPEIVRRALFQVYGNITPAERERLRLCNLEQWRQQANGNAGSQINADKAFNEELAAIVKHMSPHRLNLIANYIRGSLL